MSIDYQINKIDGLITIGKVDNQNFTLTTKQFSQRNGLEIDSIVQGISLDSINNQIIAKQNQLSDLLALQRDLLAL